MARNLIFLRSPDRLGRPVIVLYCRKEVRAIFRAARKKAGISQIEASFRSGVPLKRLQKIEDSSNWVLPGDVRQLDKAYNANRLLVMRYCGTCCPEGVYAGMRFEEISPQSAGIRLITSLTGVEKLLPSVVEVICEICDRVCDPDGNEKRAEVCAQLSQLRRHIMAIEALVLSEQPPTDWKNAVDFLLAAERKIACAPTQTRISEEKIVN